MEVPGLDLGIPGLDLGAGRLLSLPAPCTAQAPLAQQELSVWQAAAVAPPPPPPGAVLGQPMTGGERFRKCWSVCGKKREPLPGALGERLRRAVSASWLSAGVRWDSRLTGGPSQGRRWGARGQGVLR